MLPAGSGVHGNKTVADIQDDKCTNFLILIEIKPPTSPIAYKQLS